MQTTKSFTFPRKRRLKPAARFAQVYKTGRTFVDGFGVFYVLPSPGKPTQIGLAVGKKLGSAPVRNRVKRLMREVYRHHRAELAEGWQIVWVARNRLVAAELNAYIKVFMRLSAKAALLLR